MVMQNSQPDPRAEPAAALPYPLAVAEATATQAPTRLAPALSAGRSVLEALERQGIDAVTWRYLRSQTRLNGSTLDEEIVAAGHASEEELAALVGAALGVPCERIAPDAAILRDARGGWHAGERHLRGCDGAMEARLYLAPPLETLDEIAGRLRQGTCDPSRLRVTTPGDIRAHRARASGKERALRARLSLAAERNAFSARETMRPMQASALSFAAAILVAAFALEPATVWTALHLAFALLALACILLRAAVLLVPHGRGGRDVASAATAPARLPVYSVLVALHREAGMARSIVDAIAAIDWPRSRLEVLFVCEANDPDTIAAVERAIAGEANFTVIATPRSQPQTKPKALNFALPLARGEFLVLYDAEDRPHPGQLREAFDRFRASDERLACLQAPLAIRNFAQSWWSAHFATEYAVLFRRVLPWLASHDLPIPLGGTSNHFRRSALVEVGGWDSHNVAEDADLGIRLARAGYRVGVIDLPTSESSTVRWRDWRNQRTRWIKGWLQTWLVHMRDPIRTWRDLGTRRFAVFQLLFAGMIGASLMHLVFAGYAAWALARLAGGQPLTFAPKLLMALDVFNVAAAWSIHALLAARALGRDEFAVLKRLPSLWVYWLAASWAGLRALRQLVLDPHRWEKTPHEEPDAPSRHTRSATSPDPVLLRDPG